MLRITIIDDDVDSRNLLQALLRNNKFDVRIISGAEEFQLADETQTDLFIIDINLGGVTGDEICRMIKKHPHTTHKPVIIISAHPEIQKISRDASSDACIAKPFSQKILLNTINELIRTD
jgi:DNA-binding response OmpR family regulator